MTAPLRVGVNAVFMSRGRGGMETFVRGMIGGLARHEEDVRVVLYCTEEAMATLRREEPWADAVEHVPAPNVAGALRKPIRIGSELSWLPLRARRDRLDVLHHTANVGPFVRAVPSVITVHDLIWRHFPSTAPPLSRALLGILTPLALRSADRVTTVSHFTRQDLLAAYPIAPDRVQVIYAGAGKAPVPGDAAAARRRFALGDGPVVLTLGVGFENKNVGTLVEAFAKIGPQRDATLVHLGVPLSEGEGWRARAQALGIADRVRFTGFDADVDDGALEDLYAAATVVALPSRFEGFGNPLLEAMARGVPVASSNATSLPEVGAGAAAWFDPLDVDGMAATVAELLDDPARRAELVAAGHERVGHFSFDRTGDEYLELYRSIAGRRRRSARPHQARG